MLFVSQLCAFLHGYSRTNLELLRTLTIPTNSQDEDDVYDTQCAWRAMDSPAPCDMCFTLLFRVDQLVPRA